VAEEAEPLPAEMDNRWGRLYGLVLAALALEIAGLWLLERVYW